ncbi:MAG: hypothetical protein RMK75_03460 [Aquificaceae bacterium]|nr:hypothetical protein [Aquificaceae bacterium]MDW8423363.1 hypothetical protein [Aquificaceae bacterium]
MSLYCYLPVFSKDFGTGFLMNPTEVITVISALTVVIGIKVSLFKQEN